MWKPYPGEEFDRSEFKVDVDEQKEIYSCTCKKMSRDGIPCCHVLKVMDQTGMIDQLPKSNITQARHTECVQGSPGQGMESAQSIFRK